MPDELTIEEALSELREVFPEGTVRIVSQCLVDGRRLATGEKLK